MDFKDKIDNALGQVTNCRSPREVGTTLAQTLGEIVKEASRGGNPTVDCEDLGAALQARADDLGTAVETALQSQAGRQQRETAGGQRS